MEFLKSRHTNESYSEMCEIQSLSQNYATNLPLCQMVALRSAWVLATAIVHVVQVFAVALACSCVFVYISVCVWFWLALCLMRRLRVSCVNAKTLKTKRQALLTMVPRNRAIGFQGLHRLSRRAHKIRRAPELRSRSLETTRIPGGNVAKRMVC